MRNETLIFILGARVTTSCASCRWIEKECHPERIERPAHGGLVLIWVYTREGRTRLHCHRYDGRGEYPFIEGVSRYTRWPRNDERRSRGRPYRPPSVHVANYTTGQQG